MNLLLKALLLCLALNVACCNTRARCQNQSARPTHVTLWQGANEPSFDLYVPPANVRRDTVVVIVPGGGFGSLSSYDRQLRELFYVEGYATAVLNYRVLPVRYPAPVEDVARTVRLLRHNAAGWQLKVRQVAVFGESAGGMIASIASISPNLVASQKDDLAATVSASPNLLMLLCPVISAVAVHRYAGLDRWLGPEMDDGMRAALSPELHVRREAPPAILFHAADDPVVPVEGTLALAQAYWTAGASAEVHIFPHGGHGHAFYDSRKCMTSGGRNFCSGFGCNRNPLKNQVHLLPQLQRSRSLDTR